MATGSGYILSKFDIFYLKNAFLVILMPLNYKTSKNKIHKLPNKKNLTFFFQFFKDLTLGDNIKKYFDKVFHA